MKQKLYIIKADKYRKVGISENPEKRLIGVQVGCPLHCVLEANYDIPDADKMEKRVHRILKKYNTSGEWFECSFNQIDDIVRAGDLKIAINCDNIGSVTKKKAKLDRKKHELKLKNKPKMAKIIDKDPIKAREGYSLITQEMITALFKNSTVTWDKVKMLGLRYPLPKGWKKKIIGNEIKDENLAYLYRITVKDKKKKVKCRRK